MSAVLIIIAGMPSICYSLNQGALAIPGPDQLTKVPVAPQHDFLHGRAAERQCLSVGSRDGHGVNGSQCNGRSTESIISQSAALVGEVTNPCIVRGDVLLSVLVSHGSL